MSSLSRADAENSKDELLQWKLELARSSCRS